MLHPHPVLSPRTPQTQRALPPSGPAWAVVATARASVAGSATMRGAARLIKFIPAAATGLKGVGQNR